MDPAAPLSVVALFDRISEPLIWLAVLAFLAGAALELADRRSLAVPIAGVGWALFGAFWLAMVPHFYLDAQSPLQSLLSLAGAPLSLYAGYLLVTGRDSLLILSRAIAIMGLIYLPFLLVEPARQWLIEVVTVHSAWGMELVGYDPIVEEGRNGYQSRFGFEHATGEAYSTYIVLACTGIGAISIFGGLIAAVRAPIGRKLAGVAAAVGIIYSANIVRNVFVGLAAPFRWFDYPTLESLTVLLAGESMRTSFFVSHHLIAQTGSVVALIGITLLLVRVVPEIVEPLEELLFVLTNEEYDLAAAIDADLDDRNSPEPAQPADD